MSTTARRPVHLDFYWCLFLPEEWAADYPRREEAGVPEAVVFRTKPELAVEMVQQAVDLRFALPLGDGGQRLRQQPDLRAGHPGVGKRHVVDTSADARVWLTEPVVIPAGTKGPRGRATNRPWVATKPERVDEVVCGCRSMPGMHRRRRRESGAADLRVCLLVGLVQ